MPNGHTNPKVWSETEAAVKPFREKQTSKWCCSAASREIFGTAGFDFRQTSYNVKEKFKQDVIGKKKYSWALNYSDTILAVIFYSWAQWMSLINNKTHKHTPPTQQTVESFRVHFGAANVNAFPYLMLSCWILQLLSGVCDTEHHLFAQLAWRNNSEWHAP